MSKLGMSDRVHRIVGFLQSVLIGVAGVTGISDTISKDTLAYIAIGAAVLTVVNSSWRVLFPEAPIATTTGTSGPTP